MAQAEASQEQPTDVGEADWQRRVVGRSLGTATKRSIDRGGRLVRAAAALLERSNGDGFTVQDVADEAGQSLRTLYHYFESKDDLLLAVFEEAMGTYARMIRTAIAGLEDPLERLAGAIIAAARMPEVSNPGVDRGLARFRLKLGEVDPNLVARAQEPVASLFRNLVEEASKAGAIRDCDPEEATYLIMALNSAYIIGQTLGNNSGLRRPTVLGLTSFCLEGLSASLPEGWQERLSAGVRIPSERIRIGPAGQVKASRSRSEAVRKASR
jgi:AcrR family transcriptional regulator